MRGVAKWLHSFISFIPRTDWLFVVTYSRPSLSRPCHVLSVADKEQRLTRLSFGDFDYPTARR